VAGAIRALAEAGRQLARLIAEGPGAGHGAVVGANADGDHQKALDTLAHRMVLEQLRGAGVALVGSEEAVEPELLDPAGLVAVAVDPLDGSSNIETNVSVGTIFSILPLTEVGNPFLQPGSAQLAAGFIVYGPHTDLILTVRAGTVVFTLDREQGCFRLSRAGVTIADETGEFAINASNYRHWFDGVRQYVDDCLAGVEGPRRKNFNMRWIASLVAEASRILARGGVFLYPRDQRSGYARGRLRLTYEANPLALVVEQAGGRASDGFERILNLTPVDLHQRTPLIFGAAHEVARIERYKASHGGAGERSVAGPRGVLRR